MNGTGFARPGAGVLFTVAGTAAVAAPWLLDAYTISLASYALVLVLVTASAHVLCSMTALPSLGQAAYLGVGAYTAAVCAESVSTDGLTQVAAAATAAGAAAAIIGSVVTRTRTTVFMILTLMVGELAHTAAEHAGQGLAAPTTTLAGQRLSDSGPAYLYVLAVTAIVLAAVTVLRRSYVGLVWRGLGEHEARIRANGHLADAHLWAAYVTCGVIAGVAGALLVTAHRYVGPADMSSDVSALVLLAAIIGGRSLVTAGTAAVAIVAVRDLLGAQFTGHTPLLLGVAFLAAAYHPQLRARLARSRR